MLLSIVIIILFWSMTHGGLSALAGSGNNEFIEETPLPESVKQALGK